MASVPEWTTEPYLRSRSQWQPPDHGIIMSAEMEYGIRITVRHTGLARTIPWRVNRGKGTWRDTGMAGTGRISVPVSKDL